jgi:hypothetical protein
MKNRDRRQGAGTGRTFLCGLTAEAVLRQGRQRSVHLALVPPVERAPILSEYVRVATSGRHHFPVAVGAPLSEFAAIAERYPIDRVEPYVT